MSFTATVGLVAPGAGTPTGTVAFLDGGTHLGVVALGPGGQAVLTTSALTAGVHTITAVYSGDGNFSSSANGSPLTETVRLDGDANQDGTVDIEDLTIC